MYYRESSKVKTAAKTITYNDKKLKNMILQTLKEVSQLVGDTLGPNGKIVLIERQEMLPPFSTKDGITVFQAMAYSDSTKQAILEAARDASAKTNNDAGDGPQPLYSKILTPNGFIAMGQLEVGMDISGTNGTIQKVVGVFPKGQKEICKVVLADGKEVECCNDHLWELAHKEVLTTQRMIELLNERILFLPVQEPDKDKKYVRVANIIKTGKFTEMQCIKVSNPDSLYITDNYVVTHNTTSASILAEALIRLGFEFLEANPRTSPQKVMRELEDAFNSFIKPFIEGNALKLTNDNSTDLLKKVAMVATNNDREMSEAVLEAFDVVGHNGNMTILETPGISGFEVEKIDGFHIPRGYEDTCGRFLEDFINDRANNKTVLSKPKFVLYNGKVNDINVLLPIMNKVVEASDQNRRSQDLPVFSDSIVIVAHHFSENVLGALAQNFKQPGTVKFLPLKTYMTPQANSPFHFLMDMSAFTGSVVFDPITKPVENAELHELGIDSMTAFEYGRYKSVVFGRPEEMFLLPRAEELRGQMENAVSIQDKEIYNERIGILTGGIARIKVMGSSESELKEKKHRVEDAIASIKGALKYGVLPGCAKTLLTLSYVLTNSEVSQAVKTILGKAFQYPFYRIFQNGGYHVDEISEFRQNVMFTDDKESPKDFFYTYDALNHKYGDAVEIGILDSTAAVLMAIKNSLGVAKMLMCLSGIVVFQRDAELDRQNALEAESDERITKSAEQNEGWEPPY